MVECYILDDFNKGDWVGVHYQEPGKKFYCFPTEIANIKNRCCQGIENIVEVTHTPEGCPKILQRVNMSRIWHTVEAESCDGH